MKEKKSFHKIYFFGGGGGGGGGGGWKLERLVGKLPPPPPLDIHTSLQVHRVPGKILPQTGSTQQEMAKFPSMCTPRRCT